VVFFVDVVLLCVSLDIVTLVISIIFCYICPLNWKITSKFSKNILFKMHNGCRWRGQLRNIKIKMKAERLQKG